MGKGELGQKWQGKCPKSACFCSSKHVSRLCRVGMSPGPVGGRSPWRSPGPNSVASAQRPPFKRPDGRRYVFLLPHLPPTYACFSPPPILRCQRVSRPSVRFCDPHLQLLEAGRHRRWHYFGVSLFRLYVARRLQRPPPQCTQSTSPVVRSHSAAPALPTPSSASKSDRP